MRRGSVRPISPATPLRDPFTRTRFRTIGRSLPASSTISPSATLASPPRRQIIRWGILSITFQFQPLFGPGFTGFCFQTQNYYGLGNGLNNCTSGVLNYEIDRTRDIQDTIFWNKGAHSIKLGARYMWFQAASGTKSGYNGYYYFSGAETAQVVNGSPQAVTTGNSYASFLLGLVNNANMQQLDSPDLHEQTLGIYAEDQRRAAKNLSINFGLRWDIEPPVYDTQNRLSAMNPNTPICGRAAFPAPTPLLLSFTSGISLPLISAAGRRASASPTA